MSTPTPSQHVLMELPSWEQRSAVSAAMINPALVALVIAISANRYEHEIGMAMPWELSFLVVPMALHSETRQVLPNRISSHMPKWVNDNPVITAGLGSRAKSLSPYVREGIRWGVRTSALTFEGPLLHGQVLGRFSRHDTNDLRAIAAAARFLGRWFSSVNSTATVFALLGVTP